MLRRKHLIALVVIMAASLVLSACGPSGNSDGGSKPAAEKIIKVGASVPLTGGLAKEGKLTEQGYRLWEETANSKGGIDVGGEKYKVELILYDDKSDAQTSAKLTEKLITEDKVDFLLAPYSSGLVQAASSIAEKYKIINIAPTANSASIYERGYKYVYSLLPTASSNLSTCLEMAPDYNLDLKTVAIVTPDDLFPTFAAEGARQMAESKGMQVVWFAKYPKGTSDFSTIVSELKQLNPDAILSPAYFEEAVLLVRQLKEQKVNPKMLAFTGPPGIPDFVTTLGKDAEGIVGHMWWTPNTGWDGPLFGTAEDYTNLFKDKFGFEPPYHAAAASADGLVLQLAIEKAGSLDMEKVRTALNELDVETFFMPVKFGKVGNADNFNIAGKSIPTQIQNGKLVVIYPEKIKQAEPDYPIKPWGER